MANLAEISIVIFSDPQVSVGIISQLHYNRAIHLVSNLSFTRHSTMQLCTE